MFKLDVFEKSIKNILWYVNILLLIFQISQFSDCLKIIFVEFHSIIANLHNHVRTTIRKYFNCTGSLLS